MRAVGVEPEPAIYSYDFADEVRAQLLGVGGVQLWVNPIEGERGRTILDALLRKVAEAGVFVSAHPDVIQKMGTKDVLFQTRAISWGTDTHRYQTNSGIAGATALTSIQGKAPRPETVSRQWR